MSQRMYTCNMKALPPLVNRELWARLKFFENRSNFKVKVIRSKSLVPMEKSCHKECTCNIKPQPLLVRKLWPRFNFFKSRSNFKVKVTRSNILVPKEKSCHKEYTCEI